MYSLRTDSTSACCTYLAGTRFAFLCLPEYTLLIITGLDKFYNLHIIIPGEGGEEESPFVDYGEEEEQGEEEEEDEEG